MIDESHTKNKKAAALRQGVIVAVALVVLTVIEFVVGAVWPVGWLLLLLGLMKAVVVIQYYMHVSHVFNGGGEH